MAKLRIVIVGAGVVGAACAYYLSLADVALTVLDAADIGGGTSSRCDGNVLAIDKDPGFDSQMALKSQALLHQLAAELGPIEYRRPGSYLVCDNEEEVEMAQEWVSQQLDQGLPFLFLDRDHIHRHLPHIADDIPGGLFCGSDSTLNPLLYTQQLIAKSRERGATILPHQPVDSFIVHSNAVCGVRLRSGEEIFADRVVVASGVFTPQLVQPLGIRLPIEPRKGQLLVSAKGPLFGDAKVMEFGYLMSKFGRTRKAPADAMRYGVALVYEPTLSHNFLLGSSREFVGFDTAPDVEVSKSIARRAMRFYPGMKQATLMRSYAGLRPWTPDHFPVVSFVKAVPGLVIAAGHEGDGIGLAAVTGHLVADMLLEREPIVDPKCLMLDRASLLEQSQV